MKKKRSKKKNDTPNAKSEKMLKCRVVTACFCTPPFKISDFITIHFILNVVMFPVSYY